MQIECLQGASLTRIEDTLWVLLPGESQRLHLHMTTYDMPFESVFACQHPWQRPQVVDAVARIGAFSSQYEDVYSTLLQDGIKLIHTPEEHYRCSVLSQWYPLIEDLTPKSLCFHGPPKEYLIEQELGWPIFMKGERQTSYHRRKLSIIHNRQELREALALYATDPVLQWQNIACRQFIPLRLVTDDSPDRIPASFEFRTFWWKGELVGMGAYWWQVRSYSITPREQEAAIDIAQQAAERVQVTFLVIDVAQTQDGRWIVIECNDGQETGYCTASPIGLWNEVIRIERGRTIDRV